MTIGKITNENCLACGLYKECRNPMVTGESGKGRVRRVIILPFPEAEDDSGKPFQGPNASSILTQAQSMRGLYATYLVKCPSWKNPLSPRMGYKDPSAAQIHQCMKHLAKEFEGFDDDVQIMGFGSTVLKALTGDPKAKISYMTGHLTKVKIGEREFDFVANIDPKQLEYVPQAKKQFDTLIQKFIDGQITEDADNDSEFDEKHAVLSPAEAIKLMDRVIRLYKKGEIPYVTYDSETSVSLLPWGGGEIIMTSLAIPGKDFSWAIPFVRLDDPETDRGLVLSPEQKKLIAKYKHLDFPITDSDRAKLRAKTKELLETVPIAGHNLKYDIKWAVWHFAVNPLLVQIFMDTYDVSFQVNSTGPGVDNSLKGNARQCFAVTEDWDRVVHMYLGGFRLTKDRHFGNIPTGMLARYAALDTYYNNMLVAHFMENVPQSLLDAAYNVTRAIIPYVEAETSGMAIDKDIHGYLKREYEQYLKDKFKHICELPKVSRMVAEYLKPIVEANTRKKKPLPMTELKWQALNLKNAAKVSSLFYESKYYNLPKLNDFRTPAGGYSTGKEVRKHMLEAVLTDAKLEAIRKKGKKDQKAYDVLVEARDFVKSLHDFKRITKLLDDYLKSMESDMVEGIFRTSFNPNGTITGRASSPFHSMPNRCDVKRIIASRWAGRGGLIIACDESQLEYRVIAALSGERTMIDSFNRGEDPHAFTASLIFGVPIDQVTGPQRDLGKRINFAMLYGKTEEGLAEELNISVSEARNLIQTFYAKADSLKKWMDEQYRFVKRTGYVETLFGRRIPVQDTDKNTEFAQAEVRRLAINYPIQSTSSDIVLDFYTNVYYDKVEAGLKSKFLASVHDSVEYDAHPGELFHMIRLLKFHGQDNVQNKFGWLSCPLELSFEIGTSWGGAIEAEIEHVEDKKLVTHVSGLKRDFDAFITEARNAYKAKVYDYAEAVVDVKKFADDIFVRDDRSVSAKIEMRLK